MCLCILSPRPRDLRRAIKDLEEDALVPRAPSERFINLICFKLHIIFSFLHTNVSLC